MLDGVILILHRKINIFQMYFLRQAVSSLKYCSHIAHRTPEKKRQEVNQLTVNAVCKKIVRLKKMKKIKNKWISKMGKGLRCPLTQPGFCQDEKWGSEPV
jgi:hypothetical protein